MVFSGLIFLFFFLPVVLALYYMVPRRFRNVFLLVVNLIFYGWGEPVFLLIMLISILANYVCGLLIGQAGSQRTKKMYLVISVIISLGLLGLFKYTNFIVNTLSVIPGFAGLSKGVPLIPLPIGISFYTFQAMSYTIDVYRKDVKSQKNFVTFATYVSLFPQLIAGPIVRYRDVERELENNRRESLEQFASGIPIFIVGLAKKVLIANQMGLLWDTLRPTAVENGLIGIWIGVLAFTFQIYFDFSGYSDMAIGLGRMFGFEFLENFHYPYISKSITEFWRRWHMSLSSWFRDYVYIPLGGNQKGVRRQIFNLFVVWALTGMWHGASWNFILWGLYYFVFLVLEKFILQKYLEKMPSAVTHFYVLFIVMCGWMLFYFENLSQLGAYIQLMFSLKQGLLSRHAMSIVTSYLPLLAASAIASLPAGKMLYEKHKEQPEMQVIQVAGCIVLMLLCTAALTSQSYNPFLYFRF